MLTSIHLTELRNYLKEFKAYPKDEADQPKAELINQVLPAWIDTITDEDLTAMCHEMWGFVTTNLINNLTQKEADGQEEAQPLVELN